MVSMLLQELPHSILVSVFTFVAVEVNTGHAAGGVFSGLAGRRILPLHPYALSRQLAAACAEVQSRVAAPKSVHQFVKWAALVVSGRTAGRLRWLIVPAPSTEPDVNILTAALLFVLPHLAQLVTLEIDGVLAHFDLVGCAIETWTSVQALNWGSVDQWDDAAERLALRHLGGVAVDRLRALTLHNFDLDKLQDADLPLAWRELRELDLSGNDGSFVNVARFTSRCPRLRSLFIDNMEQASGAQMWDAVRPVVDTIRVLYLDGDGGSVLTGGIVEGSSGVWDLILQNATQLRLLYVYTFSAGLRSPVLPVKLSSLSHIGVGRASTFDALVFTHFVAHPSIASVALRRATQVDRIVCEVCRRAAVSLTNQDACKRRGVRFSSTSFTLRTMRRLAYEFVNRSATAC